MKKGFEIPRVTHEMFGDATLLGIIGIFSYVRFDVDPPVEYNMGENPVLMLTEEMKEIK